MEEPNLIQNQPPVQAEPAMSKKWEFTPKFIAVVIGLLIVGGAAYGYATYLAKKNFDEVSRLAEEGKKQAEGFEQKRSEPALNFDDCVSQGNPVMESFPEQCRDKSGALFVNWQGVGQYCIQVITPAKNPATSEIREFPTPCDVPEGWEML